MFGDKEKKFIITRPDDGNVHAEGVLTGIINACHMFNRKEVFDTVVRVERIAGRVYFTTYSYPHERKEIMRLIEHYYPRECRFYY